MGLGRHSTVTDPQRKELWRRYKAGETVLGIACALGQRPGNLYRALQGAGGIAPAQRSRSPRVLSFGEREEISRGIAAGSSFRTIARSLARAVSTVSQEVPGMAGGRAIAPRKPTGPPGSRHVVPSAVGSPRTGRCSGSSRLN